MKELLLSVVMETAYVNSSESLGDNLKLEDFLGVTGWDEGDDSEDEVVAMSVAVHGTVGVTEEASSLDASDFADADLRESSGTYFNDTADADV